jgi:hypothetical protein
MPTPEMRARKTRRKMGERRAKSLAPQRCRLKQQDTEYRYWRPDREENALPDCTPKKKVKIVGGKRAKLGGDGFRLIRDYGGRSGRFGQYGGHEGYETQHHTYTGKM